MHFLHPSTSPSHTYQLLASMAALEIPGQPKRWGNESTNFYQASYTLSPGVASRDKVYRCYGSQYANSGHYHLGAKALNLLVLLVYKEVV